MGKSLVEKIEIHLDEINKEIRPRLVELESFKEKIRKRMEVIEQNINFLKEQHSETGIIASELEDVKRRIQELEKFKPVLEKGKRIKIFCGHVGSIVNFRIRDIEGDKEVQLPYSFVRGLITGEAIDLDDEEKVFDIDGANEIIDAIQSDGDDRIHGFEKFRQMVLKIDNSGSKEPEIKEGIKEKQSFEGLNLTELQKQILDKLYDLNGMVNIKILMEEVGIGEKNFKSNLDEIKTLGIIVIEDESVKFSPNFNQTPT